MSTRRRSLFTLVAAGVIALVATVAMIAGGLFTSTEKQVYPVSPAAPEAPHAAAVAPRALPAQPVHVPVGQPPGTIRLPQGGTAELVRKEIDRSGTLPVPDGIAEATWWGAGLDAPKGATVLAGHVNWKGSVGPFSELWESRSGEQVTVVDDGGREWRYQVSEVVTVHKDDLPARARELFGQGGAHRLVLVTCGGRYVGGDLGYDDNRIVVATPA
ncbi:class F sortase [Saccharopolyspora spinosa]|uniref:Sortase family protein n=1 Tax=Saccharopolyspora spinosa TaxID=60894 RepID=A0A2N3XUH8_SACSN|nr:class F sortase [Saccharopolyspora spinosa]PKW14343.1 sortase family protein [Saccharopolyspora spinosa]